MGLFGGSKKVAVHKTPITLVQFLKWGGFAQTGSEAKSLVREGLVRLNGKVCYIPGKQLGPRDKVEVLDEGKLWEMAELYLEDDEEL